jgi:ClpP class serine protease
VRNGFGEGRMVSAYQAVNLGMADRVGTLDETINQLFNKNVAPAKAQASTSVITSIELASSEPVQSSFESVSNEQTIREAQALRDYVQLYK